MKTCVRLKFDVKVAWKWHKNHQLITEKHQMDCKSVTLENSENTPSSKYLLAVYSCCKRYLTSTLVSFDQLCFNEWLIYETLSARAKQSDSGIRQNCSPSCDSVIEGFVNGIFWIWIVLWRTCGGRISQQVAKAHTGTTEHGKKYVHCSWHQCPAHYKFSFFVLVDKVTKIQKCYVIVYLLF